MGRATLIDTFLYAGLGAENALVELRLHELDGLASYHRIVEGYEDFQGHPKPLRFPALLRWLRGFESRIDYRPIHLPETNVHPRAPGGRERFSRDALVSDLGAGAPDDIVMISDCDEIPRAAALEPVLSAGWVLGVQLGLTPYYLWWNLLVTSPVGQTRGQETTWPGPILVRRSRVDSGISAYELRDVPGNPLLPHAGWHFSFAGSPAQGVAKLRAWGHPEFVDGLHDTEANFRRALTLGEDWDHTRAGGPLRMQFVDVDESYPAYLREHMSRFRRFIHVPAMLAARHRAWEAV